MGVDLSAASIERARRRCELAGFQPDLRVADAEQLSLPGRFFRCRLFLWCDASQPEHPGMRAASLASAQARRPGTDHGVPPSVDHRSSCCGCVTDFCAGSRCVGRYSIIWRARARRPTPAEAVGLLERLREYKDGHSVQPGRLVATSAFRSISVEILSGGLETLSRRLVRSPRPTMGIVLVNLCHENRRLGCMGHYFLLFTPALQNIERPGTRPGNSTS